MAILLICHYRDDPEKLARIMDVVLDSSVHKLFPTSLPSCFYSNGPINGRLTTTSQRSNQRSRNRNPPTSELSALNLNNTGDGPLPVVSVVDGVSEPGCSTWRGGPGSDSGKNLFVYMASWPQAWQVEKCPSGHNAYKYAIPANGVSQLKRSWKDVFVSPRSFWKS